LYYTFKNIRQKGIKMENYQEVKNDMAIFILIQTVSDELVKANSSDNKEYKEFVAKIEAIKDMLVNL
jgi:hypothetical protein